MHTIQPHITSIVDPIRNHSKLPCQTVHTLSQTLPYQIPGRSNAHVTYPPVTHTITESKTFFLLFARSCAFLFLHLNAMSPVIFPSTLLVSSIHPVCPSPCHALKHSSSCFDAFLSLRVPSCTTHPLSVQQQPHKFSTSFPLFPSHLTSSCFTIFHTHHPYLIPSAPTPV